VIRGRRGARTDESEAFASLSSTFADLAAGPPAADLLNRRAAFSLSQDKGNLLLRKPLPLYGALPRQLLLARKKLLSAWTGLQGRDHRG
jgi:hypothetical protein